MSDLHPDFWQGKLRTRWAGRGVVDYHDSLPSTNSRLKELARSGAPHGSLCLCESQTAGRGRLERSWLSSKGEALTFSLLLRPRLSGQQLPLCTFAVSLAVLNCIRKLCPSLDSGIKWPNDVVVNGKKCVGILCELATDPDGANCVIAGVGINVAQPSFPEEICQTAASLLMALRTENPSAAAPSLASVLTCFLEQMEQTMALMEENPPKLLAAVETCCVTLGRQVRVIGGEEEFTATAEAMDETGALLVRDETGCVRRVLSGDVSVRGLMGYI